MVVSIIYIFNRGKSFLVSFHITFLIQAWLDKDGHEKFKLGSYVYLREHHPIQTFNIQVTFLSFFCVCRL